MDKRRDERYSFADYLEDLFSKEDYFIEIATNGSMRARIVDISMGGLGYEMKLTDSVQYQELQPGIVNIIKIFIGKEVIFAEAKNIWSCLIEKEGERIIKGGLLLSVISSENRLRLSQFIETIRKRI